MTKRVLMAASKWGHLQIKTSVNYQLQASVLRAVFSKQVFAQRRYYKVTSSSIHFFN